MKKTLAFATLGLLCLVSFLGGPRAVAADELVPRHSSLVTDGDDDSAAPAWIPFQVERDIEPGSPLDFSWIAAAHAPCGVHGRIVVRNSHFEFEKLPGKTVRFWGVNISSGANFPDEDKAEAIASHLAALGYNAVRLHHHDGGLVGQNPDAFMPCGKAAGGVRGEDSPRPFGLDPDALRRMDALVAACAKHGLYIITDIYVSRPVSWRACGIDRDGTMGKGQFKHLVPIHDGAFSNWCAFASAWLGHTNAFTGVRFADDPALLAVALINEGNLDNGASREPFVSLPNWRERWSSWLAERAKPSTKDEGRRTKNEGSVADEFVTRHSSFVLDAGEIKDFASIPEGDHWSRTRHVAAFSRFLTDVEADFEARAVRFLREDVGLKAPISNMSSWMQPPEYQSILAGPTQDYVEAHAYCDHPTFPEKQWSLPCRVGRENPVRQRMHSMGSGAMGATLKRIHGKPFCVTEFNFVAPNPHRGAGGLLFGAEAAAQDWSGAWRFDWASSKKGIEEPGTGYCGLFAFNCDPLRQASDRIAQMLFLRGDLAPCPDAYAVWLPPSKITETFDGESRQLNTPWPELAWRARLGTIWGEKPPEWARWVDPYPDFYKRGGPVADIPLREDIALNSEAGWFKVATSRTCAIFAEGGAHTAGVMRVEIAGDNAPALQDCSPTNHSSLVTHHSSLRGAGGTASATVWASSLDGKPLAESAHILVGMLTDLRNTGMEAEDGGVGTSSLSGGPTTLVRKWGGLPYLVRAGKARVELAFSWGAGPSRPAATDWRCYALSQGGRRRFEVPCEIATSGDASPQSTHIAFTADTAASPEAATFFWELLRQ